LTASANASPAQHPPSSGRPGVLILVENLPVPLDRRVWQESCALRDAGYQVTVICPRMRGHMKPEEVLEGIQIYRHWISEEASGFMGFAREYASALLGETWLAWKAWLKHRFKIIHLCNPPDLLFLVAWPFKLLGVKVIYDVHDVWPEMFEAKFQRRGAVYSLVRLAERWTYACADVVLATNTSVQSIALQRGHKNADRVFVVRTAPRVAASNYRASPELKKGRKFLVGYVGVMGNADGVDLVLQAAHHIVHGKKRHDVQFLLMGTGPEFERLTTLRRELQLEDWVDMPGRVTNEFLFSALQTIDLGVSSDPINPYNHHCTMNKVLEYMTFGKAQVLFDLKEGRASAAEAGHYVSPSTGPALAHGILSLLDDPVQRKTMGEAGARRMREVLNWDCSVEQLLAAYAKVLEPQKTRNRFD